MFIKQRPETNRFVAIKILKPEYSSDRSFVNKLGEAQFKDPIPIL